MRRVLDYNPLTGETLYFDYTADDKMILTHEQDVTNILRYTQEAQNDDDKTKRGWKKDWWKYATVPNTVIVEMKQKHGVDFFDENDSKKVFRLLDTEYKRFKTTTKRHVPR